MRECHTEAHMRVVTRRRSVHICDCNTPRLDVLRLRLVEPLLARRLLFFSVREPETGANFRLRDAGAPRAQLLDLTPYDDIHLRAS